MTVVFQIEVLSAQSYANETVRAIEKDIALLPIIVGIMCAFSCWVYFKRDRVQSSCLCLGIGAVASVILSLITSYGILFLVGIPFSTLTAAVPFVVLGIGLDGEKNKICDVDYTYIHDSKVHLILLHTSFVQTHSLSPGLSSALIQQCR